MKTAILLIALLAFTVSAQPAKSSDKTQNESGVKVLSFGATSKKTSQLELTEVPNNPAVIPTAPSNYGAEYSKEPMRNSQYYHYEKRNVSVPYMTAWVKNDSGKTIKSIVWEYTDPHFQGDKEIAYTEATTKLPIAAGRTATLSTKIPEHKDCGNIVMMKDGETYTGRTCGRGTRKSTQIYPLTVKVKQITYEDGTVWKAQ